MKYTEGYTGRGKKFGTGFYILIACCLLIIGGASWFALSNMAGSDVKTPKEPEQNNSYNSDNSSYNEKVDPTPTLPEMSESVAQSTENEPYESNESTTAPTEEASFAMPVEGEILKGFSNKELQYSATYGDMRLHCGLDIACNNGTAVSACSDGTVKSIENSGEYGTVVTIEHTGGITVKYCALTDLKVENGAKVKTGDIIGCTAAIPAECNDKPHLHLEATVDGKAVSPIEALGFAE